ncbi:MAG TPA: hypothetical protein VKO87_16060, partial [Gemmatimonadaceae bacterium]|nr:hypothetical protein [Gemmatimonadaceae bacterium]
MKAKYFLPVAAVLFAACSEPTSPVANLEVSAGKQTQPPPSTAPVETFDNGVASLSAWSPLLLTTSPGSA